MISKFHKSDSSSDWRNRASALHAQGYSWKEIQAIFERDGIRTKHGKKITTTDIYAWRYQENKKLKLSRGSV